MAIGRESLAALLVPGLRKVYFETGEERPEEFRMVFNTPSMEWNPITDQQISGLGTAVSMPEGDRFTIDRPILGGTRSYEAVPYGLGFEVTYAMWRDEKYGVMREEAKLLGRASRNRMEVDAWSILNNGFTSGYNGFDGLPLFSTAHTRLDGGTTQANRPSPDIGLSQTATQAMFLRYEGMVDHRGLPRLMNPSMIVIPPALKFVARELFGSEKKPGTSDNEINPLMEEEFGYMVAHYLTSSTAWFSLAPRGIHDLNFFIRDEAQFDGFDDPNTKNAIFCVWQRHIPGFGDWQGADGTTGQ